MQQGHLSNKAKRVYGKCGGHHLVAKTSNKRPTQMDKVGFWDIIYMVIKIKINFLKTFVPPTFRLQFLFWY